jgi:uncharacterized damage-inducible protein DinB
MSGLLFLHELYLHMHWADAKVWDVAISIPEDKQTEKLKTVLYHHHITQYAFYHIWMNLPMEFPEISKFRTMMEVAQWASGYPEQVQSFLRELKPEDLDKEIKIPWSGRLEKMIGRKPAQTNLAQSLLQVQSHSAYHRGQANALIRQLQAEPPLVDFIAWIWLGKPQARWPQKEGK